MVSMVDGEICNKNIVIDLKYVDVITSSFDFVPRKSFHGEIVFFLNLNFYLITYRYSIAFC